MDITKHRQETEIYGVDFQNEEETNIDESGGETLSNPTVAVTQVASDDTYSDKTSEFGTLNEAVNGTIVNFQLNPASSGEQLAGKYYIIAECDTSTGRHLAEIVTLEVIDTADV